MEAVTKKKKRTTEGAVSLEAGPETDRANEGAIQKAIEYITQSIQAVTIDLTPDEVAAAIVTRLSDSAMGNPQCIRQPSLYLYWI